MRRPGREGLYNDALSFCARLTQEPTFDEVKPLECVAPVDSVDKICDVERSQLDGCVG